MITPEQRRQLIRLRLEQAHKAFHSAGVLLNADDFRGALNRLYYSMFYALLALALYHGFETSKHGQLIGWFNREFVKTGHFAPYLSKILQSAFERRSDADYELNPLPDTTEIPLIFNNAQVFIREIESFLGAEVN